MKYYNDGPRIRMSYLRLIIAANNNCSSNTLARVKSVNVKSGKNKNEMRAVVVAQLVERVASDTRDLQFESSRQQNFVLAQYVLPLTVEKTKKRQKLPGMAQFKYEIKTLV